MGIAIVENGDRIEIDVEKREINLLVDEEEVKRRYSALKKHKPEVREDVLKRYSYLVRSASTGAMLKRF